jgi:hypothetical protein
MSDRKGGAGAPHSIYGVLESMIERRLSNSSYGGANREDD